MLSSDEIRVVDSVWDQIWSSGITNPMTILDVISTVLMSYHMDETAVSDLRKYADGGDAKRLAETLFGVRRHYGIESGAEIEQTDFWQDTSSISIALDNLTPIVDRSGDVVGDIFERVLSRLSSAGHFGQFRTPHHIVEMMVDMVRPRSGEVILDPACGTGGFLIAASNFINGGDGHFIGFEVDRTVARIATANMVLHHVKSGEIRRTNGLTEALYQRPDVILANPPFAGNVEAGVSRKVGLKTGKTELLFVASMMRNLKPGGRAAVVVPSGVLSSKSKAAMYLREMLLLDNHLEAVVELPANVFSPYTGVKTGILIWKNEDHAGRRTRMIRINHDGFSLDSRRIPSEESDLHEAIRAYNGENSNLSIDVSIADLRDESYNLTPSRYLPSVKEDRRDDVGGPQITEVIEEMSQLVDEISRSVREIRGLNNG